ncbi:MAG: four-carbon acid sugar kinase family protein [Sedimentisphaerales bacterium]|nr:four-carbon acid sugar kinase family protein [Sedimentisphaerales bacterium]
MIVVIADDITGAAEIAAIGWRRGLSAQVQTTLAPRAEADLVAIDTDTRSATTDTARRIVGDLSERLRTLPVQWCFKKVDSVLRGNVGAEIEVLMKALGKTHTILAPANPSKGRVISNGRYYINNVPLDETEFADDPEHPARYSSVVDMLTVSEGFPVHASDLTTYTGQETGLVLAQAEIVNDLAQWAERLDECTLAAGGADFFQAILDKRLTSGKTLPGKTLTPMKGPKLFVCGSRSETSRRAVAEACRAGIPVCPMPEALLTSPRPSDEGLLRQWADDIVAALAASECAVIAMGQPERYSAPSAHDIRTQAATLVQQVADRTRIREVFIEGGATAGAILRRLGWDTLDVRGEYGPGVVRLGVRKSPEQTVTLKPGSYPWPDGLWTLM